MAYIPDIIDYKPFYIQTDVDERAIDTTDWGLVAKVNPFPALPTPKEPYKNEWLDENGDDEYNGEIFFDAFEFSVTFYIKAFTNPGGGAEENIISQIDSFFKKIKGGEFMIFDSYTGLGRRRVRYAGFDAEEFKRRIKKKDEWARAIFTVKFKVNDPVTRVIMFDGKLIAQETEGEA